MKIEWFQLNFLNNSNILIMKGMYVNKFYNNTKVRLVYLGFSYCLLKNIELLYCSI